MLCNAEAEVIQYLASVARHLGGCDRSDACCPALSLSRTHMQLEHVEVGAGEAIPRQLRCAAPGQMTLNELILTAVQLASMCD